MTRMKDGEFIQFDFFPFPPSVNKIYRHFKHPKTGKIVRVASPDLEDFKKRCGKYSLANRKKLQQAHDRLRDETFIKVEAFVLVREGTVFKKDGGLKKIDVSNRGKALFDALSDMLEIDDRHFNPVSIQYVFIPEGHPERVAVQLSRSDPLYLTSTEPKNPAYS